MSLNKEYENAMAPVAEEYYSLLLRKEAIEKEIDAVRVRIQSTLSQFNRDKFDTPNSPVSVVYKLKSPGERMVKGGKDVLKNMITDEQWEQIYKTGEKKPQLTVKRKDKKSGYDY